MIELFAIAALAGEPPGDAAVGERLAGLAGCPACHTAPAGVPFAGGYPIETKFGTFYGTNLTPDARTGLGAWTYGDFARAMREGEAPEGHGYWPAFPYPSFRRASDEDLGHLWAYLRGLPAVQRENTPHALQGYGAVQRWLWRTLIWQPEKDPPLPEDPVLHRGAELVEGLGHCGECHTPRTRWGRLDPKRPLAGSREPPEPAPNLTSGSGAGGWGHEDWLLFLETGMTPEGDVVGGEMARVVDHGTARLMDADREAMAAWLVVATRAASAAK